MFSVVIPLFNKEKSISETLNSVLNQTFTDFEVLVINDGSTDNSAEQAAKIKDKRVRLINKPNGGVCDARNTGITLARFKYIAFLDADDCWEQDYLNEQYKLICDFKTASMWACAYGHLIGNKKENVDHVLPQGFRNYVQNYFTIKRKTDLFCSSSTVIKKEAFDVAGLFDTRIKNSEDSDMWWRVIAHFPVVFYYKTLAYYRLDSENNTINKKPKLISYLPYYVDKFNLDPKVKDLDFLGFINNWSAVKLLYYYFESNEERKEAKQAVKKLDYSLIKIKYSLFYRGPFLFGKLAYRLMVFKKNIYASFN